MEWKSLKDYARFTNISSGFTKIIWCVAIECILLVTQKGIQISSHCRMLFLRHNNEKKKKQICALEELKMWRSGEKLTRKRHMPGILGAKKMV